MPYKISSANIANLSYVGESFQGEISRGGRELSMEGSWIYGYFVVVVVVDFCCCIT